MKITEILINQMKHSLGFDLSNLQITFKVKGKWENNTTKSIEIIDTKSNKVCFPKTGDCKIVCVKMNDSLNLFL